MNIFTKLRRCSLFSDFTDAEINDLFDSLKARMVIYPRGKLMAKDDQEAKEFCIILDGEAMEFLAHPNGSREVVKKLEAGNTFGLSQGFLTPNVLGFYVLALTEVEAVYLDISGIVELCDNSAPFYHKLFKNVLCLLSQRINELENNNSYMSIRGMRAKIAKLIYDKCMEQSSLNVVLGMNRNEMAKYLNVSRPSMSREMIRMREEGMFEFRKDKISIKNLSALEAIVKAKK